MLTPTSGSSVPPSGQIIGTLDFYDEGGVTVWMPPSDGFDDEVYESFKMTTSFLFHALTRPDWLTDYFLKHYKEVEEVPEVPKLTLIKGGREED